METVTVGRVITSATVENLEDLWEAKRGLRPASDVRQLALTDALVDTGTVSLSLPPRLIQQLGLTPTTTKMTRTAGGPRLATLYEAVRLTIQDRSCTVDVLEVPEGVPALVGQVALEILDFVIDPKGQRLIGNPEHGGEQMFDMY